MTSPTARFSLVLVLTWLGLGLAGAAVAAPRVAYTDIVSGPNTGGEGNLGAYVTLSGWGFGATQGASKVTIGGAEVGAYKAWSETRITVQPGPAVTSGAVVVTVNAESSDGAAKFTVRPGKIFFVAPGGNDATGVIGDVLHPFKDAQATFDRADFVAGDILVMRGGTWTGKNMYNAFFSFEHKGGTASDPMVLMGYPGEVAKISQTAGNGVTAWDSPGHYVIANLHIDLNNGSGTPIGYPPGAAPNGTMLDVRVVNNELTGMNEDGGGSAALEGRGKGLRYLGNLIHDNGGSKLYHAIYLDDNDGTGTSDDEIAYNVIYNQKGGRGIQIYNAGTTGISDIRVHHNIVHDIALDGLLFGDSTTTGCVASDNVIYRTGVVALQTDGMGGSCIRLNNANTVAALYNNTLFDCDQGHLGDEAAILFQAFSSATLANNLVSVLSGEQYVSGSPAAVSITASNNLWYGAGAPPSWDTATVNLDPLFVSAATGNFYLGPTSPAIDAGKATPVTTDLVGNARPQGAAFDIGAYEYCGAACAPAMPPEPSDGGAAGDAASSGDGMVSSDAGMHGAADGGTGTEGEGAGAGGCAVASMTRVPGPSFVAMLFGFAVLCRSRRRRLAAR